MLNNTFLILNKNEGLYQKIQPFILNVEMEGVEPSSKRGINMLSTCLFLTSIFERRQDQDHQPSPYPLKFHSGIEAYLNYSRFICSSVSDRFGTIASGRSLVRTPVSGLSQNLLCFD